MGQVERFETEEQYIEWYSEKHDIPIEKVRRAYYSNLFIG